MRFRRRPRIHPGLDLRVAARAEEPPPPGLDRLRRVRGERPSLAQIARAARAYHYEENPEPLREILRELPPLDA